MNNTFKPKSSGVKFLVINLNLLKQNADIQYTETFSINLSNLIGFPFLWANFSSVKFFFQIIKVQKMSVYRLEDMAPIGGERRRRWPNIR